MELDWITLYDYMTVFSRSEIKSKINKFYESFYPLKFKKTGKKTCQMHYIERVGLLGIVATYIQQTLFALQLYLEADFLSEGELKENVKLSRMFVEIEKKNLEVSLQIEKLVYIIVEVSKVYNNTVEDKGKEKGFLEIKIICSLIRMFEFFYSLHEMSGQLSPEGYQKIENSLRLFSIKVCEKSKNHIKLYPQIGEILVEILYFFSEEGPKKAFNFHSHLSDDNTGKRRTFPGRVKKLVAVLPNKQKTVLVNLNDEEFYDYLSKSGLNIPKEPVENYFRCEEEINSIIAEEENFIESILISEKFRGTRQWKEKVQEQLVNLSVEKKMTNDSKLTNLPAFRLSQDFPLNLS